MFTLILTLSADFLATVRAIATEVKDMYIDTNRVQELPLVAGTNEAEALQWVKSYEQTGYYDKVELIRA